MTKRFRWILVGLVIGLATGGIAYAVVINAPASGQRYYACVSNTGVVRYGTLRLNAPPTSCPASSDEIYSWNAKGEVGATGSAGPTGATGAQGPAAPGPKIRNIYFDEQNFTVAPRVTTEILTPVDTSECAEIALEALVSAPSGPSDGASYLNPELVKVDSETGDWLGIATAKFYWGDKGGTAYPYRYLEGGYAKEVGREFGASTSVRFFNSRYDTSLLARSVWIRCTPFG